MAKAKKQATKAAKATDGAKRQQTPAMYPTPAPTEVATPLELVAIDPKTVAIEGSVSPEEFAAIMKTLETERRRMDLVERIAGYTKTLLLRIVPHCGERPKNIAPAKWKNFEQRIKAMSKLPANAPAEACDALAALHTLFQMAEELAEAGDWPDSIDRAICYAIDFGQLLQRGQTQIDHGANVDRGKRNAKATAGANAVKKTKTDERIEAAHAEFNRRMATAKSLRMKTATLTNMSKVMEDDGTTPKWGSLRTLNRWERKWKSATPSE